VLLRRLLVLPLLAGARTTTCSPTPALSRVAVLHPRGACANAAIASAI